MELYIEESGAPHAPTLVFLHGSGTSGWMWEAQIAGLQDFHCINVDLPGHGKSNQVEWVSMADAADHVAQVIHERARGGRASVIGLSLGGYVGLHLVAKYGDSLDHAVISGVTAGPPSINALTRLQISLMYRFMKNPGFARAQAKMMFMPDDVAEHYVKSMQAMSRVAFQRILAELYVLKLPDLSRVRVPTLIAAGGKETKDTVDSIRAIPKLLPSAQGRLAPGLHHAWNGEAPELFTNMIRAWLTGKPLPENLLTP